jgi:hypothetical protein
MDEDKRTKKVRFSEQEPLKCRRIQIPFGTYYKRHLSIEASPEELNTLSHIIEKLKTLSIELPFLHEQTSLEFIENIKQLLTLTCMLPHQEYIIKNARHVLSTMIDDVTYYHHAIKTDNVNATIAMINLKLSEIDAIGAPLKTPHQIHDTHLKHCLNRLFIQSTPAHTRLYQFNSFRHELSQAKTSPYVAFDQLLQSLHTELLEKNTLHTSPHLAVLQHYLEQRLERIQHPLPEHLQSELDNLMNTYVEKQAISPAAHRKWFFLKTLLDQIHAHPEKTYAECYRLTEKITSLQLDHSRLSFFGQHRCYHFITELLQAEPDYDDATRFSC